MSPELTRNHPKESWRDVGQAGFSPAALGLAFLPVIAGIVIFLSELDNVSRAVMSDSALHRLNWAPSLGAIASSGWSGAFLVVALGPLVEEVVFRGLILRGLLGRYRPWTAILISAVLFAAMHLNPAQIPISPGLGVVLGWVFVRTARSGCACSVMR